MEIGGVCEIIIGVPTNVRTKSYFIVYRGTVKQLLYRSRGLTKIANSTTPDTFRDPVLSNYHGSRNWTKVEIGGDCETMIDIPTIFRKKVILLSTAVQ